MYKHKIPYYTSLKCLHIKTHTHSHTHIYTHSHTHIRTDKIDLQNLVPFWQPSKIVSNFDIGEKLLF